MEEILLEVKNLRVQIDTPNGTIHAVDGVNITLRRGEIFALVGESGCGKTITALSINRLLPDNAHICQDSEIILDNVPIHSLSENAMRRIRGVKVGMIFQDPTLALNPVFTVGEQLIEALSQENKFENKKALKAKAVDMLSKVRIPEPKMCVDLYPHQLSGGMKQRVMIAIALAQAPDLLIADEPTTALDMSTQAQVLNLIHDLNQQFKMAILLITHDLGIVAQMAHKVAVMYAGHIVECSSKDEFINHPKHPYSQQLFGALPERTEHNKALAAIPGFVPTLDRMFHLCRFKDRCKYVFKPCEEVKPNMVDLKNEHSVRCHWYDAKIISKLPVALRMESLLSQDEMQTEYTSTLDEGDKDTILDVTNIRVYFPITAGLFKRVVGYIKAVDDLSFNLYEGQTLAIVGESGCGKTTVGKAILRLIKPYSGKINFQHENILEFKGNAIKSFRSELQMIFQDPYSSMDPRMRIDEIIEEGMIALNIGSDAKERQERIEVLLEQVGLPLHVKKRYPHELSGGQRQRIAIARSLAVGAKLIVCDEPTSALDVSVQAQILNLLKSLQRDLGISYVFITHNVGVVNYMANYVAVMYLGRIVEYGPVDQVLSHPKHPYTQALLACVPSITSERTVFEPLRGEVPSPVNPPKGCHFSPRCPFVHKPCLQNYPPTYSLMSEHRVSCYLYESESPNKEVENHGEKYCES